jgi:DDE_Tnp_1-associated
VMTDIQRLSLDEVVLHFAQLEDPRSTINRRHPLVSVVVIAILAVLAGANGPTAIAEWAARKEEFLIAALDLPHGVPRKDVFRRVLMALRPEAFRACFLSWLESLRATAAAAAGADPPILSVDGKTARRSHDHKNGLGALHAVSI